MTQLDLFTDTRYTPPPIDQSVIASDVRRLKGQNLAILERLQKGPASNKELAGLSLKYTSRISDVRNFLERNGRTIVCERGDCGLNFYKIKKNT